MVANTLVGAHNKNYPPVILDTVFLTTIWIQFEKIYILKIMLLTLLSNMENKWKVTCDTK